MSVIVVFLIIFTPLLFKYFFISDMNSLGVVWKSHLKYDPPIASILIFGSIFFKSDFVTILALRPLETAISTSLPSESKYF